NEGDFPIFKDAQVQVTRTGQVLEDFKGKSVFDLNAQRERELAPKRAKFLATNDVQGLRKEVRRLIALPAKVGTAKVKTKDGRNRVFETEPGVLVRAGVIQLGAPPAKPLPIILLLRAGGRDTPLE